MLVKGGKFDVKIEHKFDKTTDNKLDLKMHFIQLYL